MHIHVSACGKDVVIVVPLSEEEDGDAIPLGTPVRFTFRGSAAHVFDVETGRNLEYPIAQAPEPAPEPPPTELPAPVPVPEQVPEPVPAPVPAPEPIPEPVIPQSVFDPLPEIPPEELGDPFAEDGEEG